LPERADTEKVDPEKVDKVRRSFLFLIADSPEDKKGHRYMKKELGALFLFAGVLIVSLGFVFSFSFDVSAGPAHENVDNSTLASQARIARVATIRP
jgi:hypothetical protein